MGDTEVPESHRGHVFGGHPAEESAKASASAAGKGCGRQGGQEPAAKEACQREQASAAKGQGPGAEGAKRWRGQQGRRWDQAEGQDVREGRPVSDATAVARPWSPESKKRVQND